MTLVTVLAHYAPAARDRLEKLQRRAARYGQVIAWTETARAEERQRPLWDGKRETYEQPLVDFDVTGEAPRVGPFVFLAEVERTEGGNLICGKAEIGALGRDWDGRCEHCNKPRGRTRGYVVENTETGERKIVGKSCLRDHVGTDVPAGAIALFQWEREPLGASDEESWGGGYSPWYESTRYIIAAARAAIALWGWRPNSACDGGERSTSGYVSLLWAVGQSRHHHREEIAKLEAEMTMRADEYVAVADAILAWSDAMQPRSDYEHNLKIALASDRVTGKTMGLVVSACAAFDKQKAGIEERAERAVREREQGAESTHYGDVGTRYKGVSVEVLATRGMPDRGFGPSVLYTLRAPGGELLKWFTGAEPRLAGKRIEQGDKFAADFTVKAHGEFRDAQETTITRAKVLGA